MARRPATLGDLARNNNVGILCECSGCGHSASVPLGFAVALFGRDQPVPALAKRLKCSKCGSRKVTTVPDWPSHWPGGPLYPA